MRLKLDPADGRVVLVDEQGGVIEKLPAGFDLGQSLPEGEVVPMDSKRVLSKLNDWIYRYKPDAAKKLGEDTKLRRGVMAQEMLKSSPETKAAVIKGKEGLMLDGQKSIGVAIGVLPDLERRIRKLEGKR